MGGILLFFGFLIFMLSAFMVSRSKNEYVNMLFSVSALFFSVWIFFIGLFLISNDTEIVKMSLDMHYSAGMAIIAALYAASLALVSKKPLNITDAIKVLPASMATVFALDSSFLITSVSLVDKSSVIVNTAGYVVYFGLFLLYFLMTMYNLFIVAKREYYGKTRQQVWLLFGTFMIAGVVTSVTNMTLPFFGMYHLVWLGPLSSVLFMVFLGIMVIRYRFFNFQAATLHGLAYIGSIAVIIGLYFVAVDVMAYVLNIVTTIEYKGMDLPSMFIGIVLMLLFWPVNAGFIKLIDFVFYRDRYKIKDLVAELGIIMSSSADMRYVLKKVAATLARTLGAQYITFIVMGDDETYVHGTKQRPRLTEQDIREFMTIGRSLRHAEYVAPDISFSTMKPRRHDAILRQFKVAFLVPIKKERKVIGCMIVGDSQRGRYEQRDLNALETVSNEISIAVQNMLSMVEINNMNLHLGQRVKSATRKLRLSNQKLRQMDARKDEFMGIASHQLRTPLTSIKGFVSGVLEGDAGEINDMQRMMLEQAFNSSERMVHLVGDLLNLSRIQNGKFVVNLEDSDFVAVVRDEVATLRKAAGERGIHLQEHIDKDIGHIYADVEKLRQVVMNFIDNAIYYSKAEGVVTVSLTKTKRHIEYRVIDNGIGVPEKVQEELFTKFFRADNAKKQRPDGTGIGLFLAKRIIDEHGGDIIFESVEGKGSTFGFRLPLKPKNKKTT